MLLVAYNFINVQQEKCMKRKSFLLASGELYINISIASFKMLDQNSDNHTK